MKSTKHFMFITFVFITLLFVSCQNDNPINPIDDPIETDKELLTFPAIINVKMDSHATRIGYDDNGTSGVKQYWELDDVFILYNTTGDSVSYKATTISSDDATATFELEGDTQLTGYVFLAVYQNGRKIDVTFTGGLPTYSFDMTGQTQSALTDPVISHLKEYDLVTSGLITNIDEDILFTSHGSLLTFKLEVPANTGTVISLTITAQNSSGAVFKTNYNATDNNTSAYTLNINNYENPTDEYTLTAYMMVPPFTLPANSDLVVNFVCSNAVLRYSGSFDEEKEFVAAMRYNFTVNDYQSYSNYTTAMSSLVNDYSNSNWNSYKPNGEGTSDNPYLIAEAWNMAWLQIATIEDNTNRSINAPDIYYKMTTNIYIDSNIDWVPIGSVSTLPFKGNFDGNGKEIRNLYITNVSNGDQGLFASTDSASISNLTVSGVIDPDGGSSFGGIVASASNTTINTCNSFVAIYPKSGSKNQSGGIVGVGKGTMVIENCNNFGQINGLNNLGGILGIFQNTSGSPIIKNCMNYGDITGTSYVGGIAGNLEVAMTIDNCTNVGLIATTNSSNVGGIAGLTQNCTITNSINSCDSVYGGANVAGVIGYSKSSTIQNCYNSSIIEATGSGTVGGIVGLGENSTINNCLNIGAISGKANVGIIIGENYNSTCTLNSNTQKGSATITN